MKGKHGAGRRPWRGAVHTLNRRKPRVDLRVYWERDDQVPLAAAPDYAWDFEYGGFVLRGEPHDRAASRRFMSIACSHAGAVRLVFGTLDRQEAEEWVGRGRGLIDVPDGRLLLPGHQVTVSAGSYSLEVLAYVPGYTGECCLLRAMQHGQTAGVQRPAVGHPKGLREPLGVYFRRTRPGEEFPAWLRRIYRSSPDEDPGHEGEWEQPGASLAGEEPRHGCGGCDHVELVVRLEPTDEKAPSKWERDLPARWECRQPEQCPLGLPSRVKYE